MANNTKTKKTADLDKLDDVITSESIDTPETVVNQKSKPAQVPDSAIINVKSNVFGGLIYVDKRTGETTEWESCGSVQPMSFAALRNMKATSIDFYKNQWIIICGFADEYADVFTAADVYKALFVTQYYKDLIEPSDYRKICSWSAEEIREKVALMSTNAQANLVVALNTYIEKGILDSLKRIKAFEEVLHCSLRIPE